MNTEQHPHDQQSPEPPPSVEATGRDPSAEMAPDAIQAADVDREKQIPEGVDVEKPARGVDWVRPSDLMARAGGAVSRRGVDFQDALSRRTRSGIAAGAHGSPPRRGGCRRCRRSAARSPRPRRRVWAGSDPGVSRHVYDPTFFP